MDKYIVKFYLKNVREWDTVNNLTLREAQELQEKYKQKGYRCLIIKQTKKVKQTKLFKMED